jgi:hypothetical protein
LLDLRALSLCLALHRAHIAGMIHWLRWNRHAFRRRNLACIRAWRHGRRCRCGGQSQAWCRFGLLCGGGRLGLDSRILQARRLDGSIRGHSLSWHSRVCAGFWPGKRQCRLGLLRGLRMYARRRLRGRSISLLRVVPGLRAAFGSRRRLSRNWNARLFRLHRADRLVQVDRAVEIARFIQPLAKRHARARGRAFRYACSPHLVDHIDIWIAASRSRRRRLGALLRRRRSFAR